MSNSNLSSSQFPKRNITAGSVHSPGNILWNIPIGWKMGLIVLVLTLAILGVGLIAQVGLNKMSEQLDTMYSFMLVPIVSISNADSAMASNQFELQKIHTENLPPDERTKSLNKIAENDEAILKMISLYETEWITTKSELFTNTLRDNNQLGLQEQEVGTFDALKTSFGLYENMSHAFIQEITAGKTDEAQAHNVIEKLSEARKDLATLIDLNSQFAGIANEAAQSAYEQTIFNTVLVLILGLLISFAMSYFIVRSVVVRLSGLTGSAHAMQEGDFGQVVSVVGRDEIGQLGVIFARMSAQLKDLFDSQEERVAERTHDLELASEVGRTMTERVANLSELLSQAVELIRSRFNLYYTQIYMADAAGHNLNLQAGTGHVGSELLRRKHHLPISSGSLNGRAVIDRTAMIVGDTLASGNFLPNPLLPLTRSEMAVPLIADGKVLGVLDMQSERPDTFSEANLPAFQVLAGQLAIAIQNARLFQQAEEAHAEVEAQASRLTTAGWQDFLNAVDRNEAIGFVYRQNEVQPAQAMPGAANGSTLRMPIEVSGAYIGEVQLTDQADRQWTSSERQVVRAVVTRVAQHVENLRLLGQAERYRAEAEQVSRRLTSEGWNEYLKTRHELADGYIYDQNQIQPLKKRSYKTGTLSMAISQSLVVHDQAIGELSVDADEKEAPHAVDIVSAIAHQLSDHIENLRLLEQTEQQRADADKLYEIGQKISIARDRQDIVAAVAENLGLDQITRALLANYEYNEAGDVESIVIVANWSTKNGDLLAPVGYRYPAQAFDSLKTFMVREPSFIGNVQTDSRLDQNSRSALLAQKVHAFIILPLWDQTRETGILLLEADDVIVFTGKELLPFLSITQQVKNALENQDLLDQTQKHASQLETVATLSTTAATVLDPELLLEEIVNLTKERFDLYHAHIYLADAEGEKLVLGSGAGEIGRQMVADQHTILITDEHSLVARATREQHPVIVDDIQNQPGFIVNPLLPDTRAEMAVPMLIGDTVMGVFDVQSKRIADFSKEDASVYTTLAAQVAVALQNARLYVEQAATVTQLRELDRLKSSFLANMSHELRTPLNSILGFADVMLEGLDGDLTENMDNDLGLIRKNGQHLLNLINDVLDMAKIESGTMSLHPEMVFVHEILDEVRNITSTFASQRHIALFITEESDQDVEIYVDRTRLRQVMINLVNNSIKFTEKGKISLDAHRIAREKILITVKDTGIGIPADKLDAIFQEFTQVDISSTRKIGGTGLGLPISRKLVEMHGGRLWAESSGVNGEGSTFYVELPLMAHIIEKK